MNVLRALIFDGEVSLTLADTTALCQEGVRLHSLSPASAFVFSKALSAMTFMSARLKEDRGEISLTLQCDGDGQAIGVSGNRALHLRGYIGNPHIEGAPMEETALGEGSFTIVRDDGYNRPFVGTCALPTPATIDRAVEEYFQISEQLPTRIATLVKQNEGGMVAFAGVIALQPLPFASEKTLQAVAGIPLSEILEALSQAEPVAVAKTYFALEEETIEKREATYRCHCSREYLAGVLATLREGELREIIREEGAVRIHCHYCNRDYAFDDQDIDKLFQK